jgi:hypothetical protein
MRIGNVISKPGQSVTGHLAVGKVRIPVIIMEGTRTGPTLYLQGLQHPTEVMGVEVIRTVASELDPRSLRGRLVMVPIANPLHAAWRNGLTTYDGIVPPRQRKRCEKVNMNRVWPGRSRGNLIERMAYAIWESICRQVEAIVDFHCCRICDHYFAAALDGHAPSIALARAFGAPLVDLQTEQSYAEGLLFLRAPTLLDKPAILVEMSPGSDVTYDMLANGVRGVHNMLKHLGMLPGRVMRPKKQVTVRRSGPVRIFRARREGYLTTYRQVGDVVAKGDLLCEIRSLDRFHLRQTVRAPFAGTCPSIGPNSGLRMVKVGEEVCTFKRVAGNP